MNVARRLGTPCPECKTLIPPGKSQCPKCKGWSFGSGGEKDVEFVRLSDARVSNVPRLRTLHPAMDKFFGGGLVKTSTTLVAAEPGCGKTTMFLQLADCISEQSEKRNVCFIANEQSPAEIRAKALEIGLVNMHAVCIVPLMGGLQGDLFALIRKLKPCLIIVDSLTKLVGRDLEFAVIVASEMKEISVELECPTLLVNQVTKELVHAGMEKLQHECDATVLGQADGQKRFWESEKNRNGPAPMVLETRMRSEEDFARGRGGLEVVGLVDPYAKPEEEEDDEPVARIGEDGEHPGPRRVKRLSEKSE